MVRLLTVGIVLLILGLVFVGVPLIASGATCTINDVQRPAEECFRIFSLVGYPLVGIGGIFIVGRLLSNVRTIEWVRPSDQGRGDLRDP